MQETLKVQGHIDTKHLKFSFQFVLNQSKQWVSITHQSPQSPCRDKNTRDVCLENERNWYK